MAAKVNNPLFNPVFFLANPGKPTNEPKKKLQEAKSVSIIVKPRYLVPSLVRQPAGHVMDEPRLVEVDKQPEDCSKSAAEMDPFVIANEMALEPVAKLRQREIHTPGFEEERVLLFKTAEKLRVEKQVKSFKIDAFRAKSEVNDKKAVIEKVRTELNKALAKVRTLKSGRELNRIQLILKNQVKGVGNSNFVSISKDEFFNSIELDQLQKKIEDAIDSIDLANVSTATFRSDVNLDCTFPTVVYSHPASEKHSYSYEYSSPPAFRIISRISLKESSKLKKIKDKSMEGADEAEVANEGDIDRSAPPAPPVRVRTRYIIKI